MISDKPIKIINKSLPRTSSCIVTGNQHIIMTGTGAMIKALACDGTHAPAGAITCHSIANFTGGGQPQPWWIIITAASHLHDQ
jgi:hypothetical protein